MWLPITVEIALFCRCTGHFGPAKILTDFKQPEQRLRDRAPRGYGRVPIASRTTSARIRSSTDRFSDDVGADTVDRSLLERHRRGNGRVPSTSRTKSTRIQPSTSARTRSSTDRLSDDIATDTVEHRSPLGRHRRGPVLNEILRRF